MELFVQRFVGRRLVLCSLLVVCSSALCCVRKFWCFLRFDLRYSFLSEAVIAIVDIVQEMLHNDYDGHFTPVVFLLRYPPPSLVIKVVFSPRFCWGISWQ